MLRCSKPLLISIPRSQNLLVQVGRGDSGERPAGSGEGEGKGRTLGEPVSKVFFCRCSHFGIIYLIKLPFLLINVGLRSQVRGADHRAAQRDRGAEQEDGGGEGRRHQGGERVRRVSGWNEIKLL